MTNSITRADLEALDRADPLRAFRDRFDLPENIIYLDGNSLGAMPRATPERVRKVVQDQWAHDLIRSWNGHGWIALQQRIGAKIGRLIGAREGETIVADSTSVNLFKLLEAGLGLRSTRRLVLSETSDFPADLYVATRHQPHISPVLSGWLGHEAPFAFEPSYRPANGIERFIVGAPPILGLTALEVGVDLMLEASMDEVRAKSVQLAEIFDALITQEIGADTFALVSPSAPEMRGSQLCYAHENGWPIMRALIDRGVIGDFRAPDILRFGFTPLYVGYVDVWNAVATLKSIV